LDSLDFKSNESFLKKDSPDHKSGFGFTERNAKIENPFLDLPKGTHPWFVFQSDSDEEEFYGFD